MDYLRIFKFLQRISAHTANLPSQQKSNCCPGSFKRTELLARSMLYIVGDNPEEPYQLLLEQYKKRHDLVTRGLLGLLRLRNLKTQLY